MWLKTECIRAVSGFLIFLSSKTNVTKVWQVTSAPQKVTDLDGKGKLPRENCIKKRPSPSLDLEHAHMMVSHSRRDI